MNQIVKGCVFGLPLNFVAGLIAAAAWLPLLTGNPTLAQEIRERELGGLSTRVIPGPVPNQPLRLGIYGTNTDTGVLIQSVQANTPAQLAGLEARDVIINVEGYQVGYVGGRLYELTQELARRVDARGEVNLLVRNHRNGQLTNVRVRFEPTHIIRGTIQAADRRPIPPAASLIVRLLDVSNPNWQGAVVQQLNLGAPRAWPVDYEMPVDVLPDSQRQRFAVDAQVIRGGQVLSDSGRPVRVSLSGNSSRANLTLRASNAQPPGAVPMDQIRQWYEKFLGRQATQRELDSWQRELERGKALDEIEASILSGSEFFDRQGEDRDRYVDEVYRQLNGSLPNSTQHERLRELLDNNSGLRFPFAREMLRQQTEKAGSNR
ncbi:MAG: YbaY family lipoprotein [bacterium]|nr:YbaY family lipoprotein [bacterium]